MEECRACGDGGGTDFDFRLLDPNMCPPICRSGCSGHQWTLTVDDWPGILIFRGLGGW